MVIEHTTESREVNRALLWFGFLGGAVAWLVSGSWSEEMDASWGCTEPDTLQSPWLRGAYERAGSYSVLVLKDGYVPWSRSGVRVFEDKCHVITVSLEARLERNP